VSTIKEDFTGEYSGQQQTLLAAGIWQTSAALMTGFLGWFLDLIVARKDVGLGAEGVGVINIGTEIFAISTLIIVGIKKSTSQKVSEKIIDNKLALQEANNGAFAIFNISLLLGIGLLISSFIIASPFSFQNYLSSILFIVGLLMFLNWYREGTHSVLSGIGEYDIIAKTRLAFFLFQLISGLLLIVIIRFSNLPVAFIFMAYAFGFVAQIIITRLYFRRIQLFNSGTFRFKLKNHEFLKNTQQGFLFAVAEIVPLNILGASTLLVTFAFTNNFAVSGAFSIAIGYSLAGLLISNFTWPLITHIAEAYGKRDHERISYNLRLVVKLFFYVTSLVIVVLIGLSRGFLHVFYGDLYLTGGTNIWVPFMLMVIGSSMASFGYILNCVLLGVGKRRPAAIYLGSLFFLIIGCCSFFLWLNPFSPQINAALGYVTGNTIMLVFLPSLMKKEINQKIPFSIGVRSILALLSTLVLAILLFWPPLSLINIKGFFLLIFCIILIGAIYLIFLIFYGAVSQSDINLLRERINNYKKFKRIVGPILTFMEKLMDISPFYKNEAPSDD